MSRIGALLHGGQCRCIEKAPWSNLDQKKGREGGHAELGALGGTLSPGGTGQRRASAGRVFTVISVDVWRRGAGLEEVSMEG